MIEQHLSIVLYVCSDDGIELKEEEEQTETWMTGELKHTTCTVKLFYW
jgi:hypothetical protein